MNISNERRAPVQRDCIRGRCYCSRKHEPGWISWEEHERAWLDYARRYGRGQSAERIAERGGFGYWELTQHLGHAPKTWEPRQ